MSLCEECSKVDVSPSAIKQLLSSKADPNEIITVERSSKSDQHLLAKSLNTSPFHLICRRKDISSELLVPFLENNAQPNFRLTRTPFELLPETDFYEIAVNDSLNIEF